MSKWKIIDNVFYNDDYENDLLIDIDNVFKSNENKEIVLCVGKVQSGKTNKIIKIMNKSLEEFNYDIVIVFAGVTNYLYNQTNKRILKNKINNISYVDKEEIKYKKYNKKNKYVLTVLKNPNNLESVHNFLYSIENLRDKKVLIIDDESDYASVNISSESYSETFNKIKQIYEFIYDGKLIQVTATPFANIISDKSIELKPKRVVVWSNPNDYRGLKEFNENSNNNYCVFDVDKNDLNEVKKTVNKTIEYSLITILNNFEKLIYKDEISILFNIDLDNDIHLQIMEFINLSLKNIKNSRKVFYENNDINLTLEKYSEYLDVIYENISVIPLNNKLIDDLEKKKKKINIFVGGTMISRGNTFENLISELILNSPTIGKISVDTLLQRARWFGYRKDIMDLMKIFMNYDIYEALIESENYVDLLTTGIHDINELYRSIQILDKKSKYVKSTGKD